MDVIKISNEIIKVLGSKDNLVKINNCMTRLRIDVKDQSKVDFETLENMDVVIRVIKDDTLQIIVGPSKSKKIADKMKEIVGDLGGNTSGDEEWKAKKAQVKEKQWKISSLLRRIANIFVPLIPAIIGAGLLNGIAGYFVNTYTAQGIKELPLWITFFQTLGGGLFGYFVVYVGINAATEFGATPGLGGIIGAITISSNITVFAQRLGLYNEATPLNSILRQGKGGIIGVILGVAILAFVEKRVRKVVPEFLDTFLTPIISLLVAGATTIFVLMPIAGFVSDAIIKFFEVLIMTEGPMAIVGGFVLASLFLCLLMVGLHHGLIPFYMIQLSQFGSISLFPVLCMAGGGQIGGAVAIYMRLKSKTKLRNIIRSALPVAILGIGEPMLYGVTLPLGKPFITASIAGGIGGAFIAATRVTTIAFGPAGVTALPLVVPNKIAFYAIGLLISYISGFVITYFFGIPKHLLEEEKEAQGKLVN